MDPSAARTSHTVELELEWTDGTSLRWQFSHTLEDEAFHISHVELQVAVAQTLNWV